MALRLGFPVSRLCTQAAFSCLDRAGTLAPLRPSTGFFTCHVARSVLASAPPPPPRLGGAESRPWHREVLGPGRSGRAGPAAWRPRGHAGLGRVPSKQVVNVGGDSSWNQDGDRVIAELATARPGPASPDAGRSPGKGPAPPAAPAGDCPCAARRASPVRVACHGVPARGCPQGCGRRRGSSAVCLSGCLFTEKGLRSGSSRGRLVDLGTRSWRTALSVHPSSV